MASSLEANPDSLNVLTEMVNKTLIETGRFFRSGASTHSKAQLKRSVPMAHEQFQSALDELSEQIFIAKAFLERDYDALQAKKAVLKPTEDVVMEESNVKQEADVEPEPEKAVVETTQPEPNPPVETTDTKPPQPNGDQAKATEHKAPEQAIKAENTDDTALGDQPLSGPGGLNFSSELNNNSNNNNNNNEEPNDFDLNLNFGDDNIGNENFLSNTNFGSAEPEKNSDQPFNTTSNNAEATEPQMTDFQMGGDAFDLELQKAGVFTGPPSDGQPGNNNNSNEDSMALGQSSFDELFMESENFGGDGGVGDPNFLEGESLMNITELDDSWFT